MVLVKAENEHKALVVQMVEETIQAVYPHYYPRGAVDYFLQCHSEKQIQRAIEKEQVFLLFVKGEPVGTGSVCGQEIGCFFILPRFQGSGYGTYLLNALEDRILGWKQKAELSASLPAYDWYLKRGYEPISYHKILTKNGDYLCYYQMQKSRLVWLKAAGKGGGQ